MAAAFTALGNESGSSQPGHELSHGNGGHHRDDLDPRLFPGFHVFGRIARAGGDDFDFFFHHHLRNLVGKGAHEHDVHADGARCFGSRNADLLPDVGAGGVACRDNAKAAAVRNGSGQRAVGDPCHAALKHRVANAQQFTNRRLYHSLTPACSG